MGSDRQHIRSLDALRGVAAFIVLGFHLEMFNRFSTILPRGYLAVDLFFILSGFVIARSYEAKIRALGGRMRFLEIRIIRIFPMVLIGSAIGLTVWVAEHGTSGVVPLLAMNSLSLPQWWTKGELFPLNSAQWSLFFELVANAIYAVVLVRWGWKPLAALTAAGLLALFYAGLTYGSLQVGWDQASAWGGFARVTFSYTAGVLLYRLRASALLPPLRVHWLAVVAAPAIGVLFLSIPQVRTIGWPAEVLTVAGLFPLIVWAAIDTKFPTCLNRTAEVLGQLSYPLYLLQAPLLVAYIMVVPTDAPLALRATGSGAFLILFVALSWAVTLVDEKVRSWLKARISARRAGSATTSRILSG